MKKFFKISLWIVIALIFIGTFVFLYLNSVPEKTEYAIIQPKIGNIEKSTVLTGKIEPRDEIDIKPQISGIISEVNVEPGDMVKEGDIIALDNKRILAKSDNVEDATMKLVKALKHEEHEMITLYYGEGVNEEDAEKLAAKIGEAYPDCDVDFHYGGQPVYYYMVSLE